MVGSPRLHAALASSLAVLLGACDGQIEEPPGVPSAVEGTAPPRDVPFRPAPAVLPRLTGVQYRNTLADLLGPDLLPVQIEADTNPYLFVSIGATTTTISERGIQQYEEAAQAVASHVFADETRRAELVGCDPGTPGDACARAFLERFGLQAWRRPLSPGELERWVALSADVAHDDPWRGLRLAVAGLLSSPYFIYRVELGEIDPNDASTRRYTSWEMASRLSFLLWDTTPDTELLAAAEREALATEAGIYAQAARMLEDPRAERAVKRFFAQYLDLDRLAQVELDSALYPHWTPTMARSMRDEIERMVADVVLVRDVDVREIFGTRRTFLNAELAALYELDVDVPAEELVPVELPPAGARAGILTTGAFLAMNAHPTETSPTRRGKYVRERVLCETINPPPDGVDFNLDDPTGEAKTLRERLEQHRSDPFCASCHKFMDPPGFLFENFDSVGAYRTAERNGYPLDTSGDLDGIPLADARDLAEVLRTDERVPRCIIKQLYRHANARLDEAGEAEALVNLEGAFADAGYRFRDLLVELVLSDGFRMIAAQAVAP